MLFPDLSSPSITMKAPRDLRSGMVVDERRDAYAIDKVHASRFNICSGLSVSFGAPVQLY